MPFLGRFAALVPCCLLGASATAAEKPVAASLHFDDVPSVKFEAPKPVKAHAPVAQPAMPATPVFAPTYYFRHQDEAKTVLRTPPAGRPAGPGWGPGLRPPGGLR